MRVERVWDSFPGHPLTDPFPPAGRHFYVALHRGDVAHPTGPGNWFKEPYFRRCWRFTTRVPLPFWSWRLAGRRGYIGAKPWGMEEPNPDSGIYIPFRSWLPARDVYPGSTALHFSARNGMTAGLLAAPVVAGVCAWWIFSMFG